MYSRRRCIKKKHLSNNARVRAIIRNRVIFAFVFSTTTRRCPSQSVVSSGSNGRIICFFSISDRSLHVVCDVRASCTTIRDGAGEHGLVKRPSRRRDDGGILIRSVFSCRGCERVAPRCSRMTSSAAPVAPRAAHPFQRVRTKQQSDIGRRLYGDDLTGRAGLSRGITFRRQRSVYHKHPK